MIKILFIFSLIHLLTPVVHAQLPDEEVTRIAEEARSGSGIGSPVLPDFLPWLSDATSLAPSLEMEVGSLHRFY